ncbi:serine/threonine-protein kinase [Actinomadura parmotrematis]|uniref:Protein kinase n=1 Tax=Actinomadura parmotrematis TaxID=2864039 RepID=A0ABS7FMK7_9ACTN|nr:serine/threonine-protein kinase [Actinomadura parmotrematis]MBW8481465.1 protein kinase [Actinomadura parmotrematis]
MPELQPGDPRRLGSYEILERLGEGGQGVVYLGRDGGGRQAAIKLLRADLTEDAAARNRFIREAQAAKQVARFCTAQVLEVDMAGDRPYIASEYVPGPSLYAQIRAQGPITEASLDRLAIGTTTALVAIHQAGIVHRDFKPHNVIMAPDGPRVIDFGIARALDVGQTAATKAIGTPSYMAPEQVAGAKLTEAVDVWAWAATMVYAATGRPPFGDDTVVAVINRVMNEPPSLHGVPADMQQLLASCLQKDPARRPTAQQLMLNLIGAAPAAQTHLDDPAQATTFLAEGEHMAAGAVVPQDPYGGGATRVSPAAYTGTLPPAPGYADATRAGGYAGATQAGGYGGATRAGGYGYDDGGRDGRSPWPIVAAVGAIVVLAAIVFFAMKGLGGGGPATDDSPTPSDSVSATESEQETESSEPAPTRTRVRTPTARPTTREPTSEPTTSEPTSEPTTSAPSTEPTGGTGGGGTGGDGGTGGTGTGPGDGTGTGTGTGTGGGNAQSQSRSEGGNG